MVWILAALAETPEVGVSEEVTRAATQLGVDVELAGACVQTVELIYERKYPEAKRYIDEVQAYWPGVGIAPFGAALMYQALMFENFDFRYERQYTLAAEAATEELRRGLSTPGNDVLERFFLAAIQGIDAIHALRKGEYLAALNKAIAGMGDLKKVEETAPDFVDARLGDGLYLYWRSAITEQSSALPDFPDQRAAGVDAMKDVEKNGIFLRFGASLSLAYAYLEQKDYKLALDRCLYIRARYPGNVVNNMTLGRVYTALKRPNDALRIYDEILAAYPENQRSWYHKGVVYTELGRYPEAQAALETYLRFTEPPSDARAQAHFRLGIAQAHQGQTDQARQSFEASIRQDATNPHARQALTRLNNGTLLTHTIEDDP